MSDIIEDVYDRILKKEEESEMSLDAIGRFKKKKVKLSLKYSDRKWMMFAYYLNDASIVLNVSAVDNEYDNVKKYFDEMVKKYNLKIKKKRFRIW